MNVRRAWPTTYGRRPGVPRTDQKRSMSDVETLFLGHEGRYSPCWAAERVVLISGEEESGIGDTSIATKGRTLRMVAFLPSVRRLVTRPLETSDRGSIPHTPGNPGMRSLIADPSCILRDRSSWIQYGTYGKNSSRRVGREHIPGWNMAREQQGHGMPY